MREIFRREKHTERGKWAEVRQGQTPASCVPQRSRAAGSACWSLTSRERCWGQQGYPGHHSQAFTNGPVWALWPRGTDFLNIPCNSTNSSVWHNRWNYFQPFHADLVHQLMWLMWWAEVCCDPAKHSTGSQDCCWWTHSHIPTVLYEKALGSRSTFAHNIINAPCKPFPLNVLVWRGLRPTDCLDVFMRVL